MKMLQGQIDSLRAKQNTGSFAGSEEVHIEPPILRQNDDNRSRPLDDSQLLQYPAESQTPLAPHLKNLPWPRNFSIPAKLPEYDGESDP